MKYNEILRNKIRYEIKNTTDKKEKTRKQKIRKVTPKY